MLRFALLLPLAACACTIPPNAAVAPIAGIRPAIADGTLQGYWTITSVNGRMGSGLWLELGGEGLATVTKTDEGLFVGSRQPPTRAFLGCNAWNPSGWTRDGSKLILGREMSRRTERGCDSATEALEDEAYAILSEPMAIQFHGAGRMRLINANGTLDLLRKDAEGE